MTKQEPSNTHIDNSKKIKINIDQEGPGSITTGDIITGDKITADTLTINKVEGDQTNYNAAGDLHIGLTVEQVETLFLTLKNEDQPLVWDGRAPYLGLTAFQESDAQFFFGREALVDDLLERVETSTFITISGPSGSGKSSVARAGLFHALRTGRLEKSDQWLLATMKPEGNPIDQLARSFARATKSIAAAKEIRQNPHAFIDQVDIHLTDDPTQRFVLLVDQFEETFTQTKDPAMRTAFIDLLSTAAQDPHNRIVIILSLRSDFISHCTVHPNLRQLMSKQLQLVGAMGPEDLAKAVSLPAITVGAEIDPALVSRIITDMKGEPGSLPLMSFALRDLFDVEQTKKGEPMDITLPEYIKRGGIESALERHAQTVFQKFSKEQQQLTKSIFSRLVEIGQGRVDTRRTAPLAELIPAEKGRDLVTKTLTKLAQADARLITISGELEGVKASNATVTLAHEKLIDAWPWLRQLVDENREVIALQNQISTDAQEWQAHDDNGFLYRGGRLAQIEEKLPKLGDLDDLSQRFVQEAINARKTEILEKEAQRQRELEQQQELAEEQRLRADEAVKSTQKLIQRRNIAFGLMGIALTLAVAAFILFNTAQESATKAQTLGTAEAVARVTADWNAAEAATSAAVALQNEQIAQENADLAAANQIVAEANEAQAFAEATKAVQAQQTAEANELIADRQRTISSAQSMLALSSVSIINGRSPSITETANSLLMGIEAIRINDILGANIDQSLSDTQLRSILDQNYRMPWQAKLEGHADSVRSIAVSPNGQTLASASEDQTIRLWDLTNLSAPPKILNGHTSPILSVAFSPNGETIASSSDDQTIRLWDINNLSTPPKVLNGHTAPVLSVAFSPDGQTLASASEDQTIRLWNINNLSALPTILEGHSSKVWSATFSPDGQTLASASEDQTTRLWDLTNLSTTPTILDDHPSPVRSAVFSPDGQTLASAGADGIVRVWDLTNLSAPPITLKDHTAIILSVAFSPDSHTIASASDDKTIRLWDLTNLTSPPTILDGHSRTIWSAIFSPDGQTLISASNDDTIRLWDLTPPPATPILLKGHAADILSVAFSPDGQTIASTSEDLTIRLWDTTDLSAPPMILKGHTDGVISVAFSPDGQTIASSSKDQTIRLWDLTNLSAPPTILKGHTDWIISVAFSPDGQTIASASFDQTVRLWDIANLAAPSTPLEGHIGWVVAIAFSPDGQTLASAGHDQKIRLWDMANPTALPTIIEDRADAVVSVAFSPMAKPLPPPILTKQYTCGT